MMLVRIRYRKYRNPSVALFFKITNQRVVAKCYFDSVKITNSHCAFVAAGLINIAVFRLVGYSIWIGEAAGSSPACYTSGVVEKSYFES
jgi:hypothetical protein